MELSIRICIRIKLLCQCIQKLKIVFWPINAFGFFFVFWFRTWTCPLTTAQYCQCDIDKVVYGIDH